MKNPSKLFLLVIYQTIERYKNKRTTLGLSRKKSFYSSNIKKHIYRYTWWNNHNKKVALNSMGIRASMFPKNTYLSPKVLIRTFLIFVERYFKWVCLKDEDYEKTRDVLFQSKQKLYCTELGLHVSLHTQISSKEKSPKQNWNITEHN